MMNPLAMKATIYAIIALGAFYGGYKLRDLSADADIAELKENARIERLAARELLNREVYENGKLKDQIHTQSIENKKTIEAAHQRLAAVGRVQLPATLCADYSSPDPTSGSSFSPAGARVLPEQTEGQVGNAQRAMDEFIAGLKADYEVMDGVVEMCRITSDWAGQF